MMSDALSDIALADREKLEYFCAINTIAKYIADRAYRRPNEIRARYLLLAYTETTNQISLTTEELLKERSEK
jgi:hypothetical protein